MTAADGSIFFEKIFETNLKEKRYNIFFPRCYNDEITSHTKRHFYTDEKIFWLFCIENGFAKYFGKCPSQFIYLNILFHTWW